MTIGSILKSPQLIQQFTAPLRFVLPGSLKTTCIHTGGAAGTVHRQVHLAVEAAAADAAHIPQAGPGRPEQEREDRPNCCFSQYNTLFLASREASPGERKLTLTDQNICCKPQLLGVWSRLLK